MDVCRNTVFSINRHKLNTCFIIIRFNNCQGSVGATTDDPPFPSLQQWQNVNIAYHLNALKIHLRFNNTLVNT